MQETSHSTTPQKIHFPSLDQFMDWQATYLLRSAYSILGYGASHLLREIAKKRGGNWDRTNQSEGFYDKLFFPFEEGELTIERPWLDSPELKYEGHRVTYYGQIQDYIEARAIFYLAALDQEERRHYVDYVCKLKHIRKEEERKRIEKILCQL